MRSPNRLHRPMGLGWGRQGHAVGRPRLCRWLVQVSHCGNGQHGLLPHQSPGGQGTLLPAAPGEHRQHGARELPAPSEQLAAPSRHRHAITGTLPRQPPVSHRGLPTPPCVWVPHACAHPAALPPHTDPLATPSPPSSPPAPRNQPGTCPSPWLGRGCGWRPETSASAPRPDSRGRERQTGQVRGQRLHRQLRSIEGDIVTV